ncbi:MAG: RNA-binding S4 domain-containing protein [Candidatus Krumholzibacteria bacterium]|jgi:ribosomal 50S subunit-recycling heat shock protein|nr:RNA-binding S4 domain-containing protein [Candidatus Krumholzibacteria bacterium]MDP6668339.1 RNA-binding S4 domain-containing protein [Candidatus Krumholzibacteria bacterium]MDP6796378.1 RNA-binding S4 domain-containing protein [Candidatus Krumholzibacteria bacterium]MDP7022208.1 RNA-binding S4 domain-containing protein [Candidatus Krumholzibacteria bacterium]
MRLDLWLKRVCLIQSRSMAKRGCHEEKILLAGEAVKESHSVREGELLTLIFPGRSLEIEVLKVPSGNVSKKEAPDFYRVLGEELV